MRSAVALQHGATEELLGAVADYEATELPEELKLLLRVCDALALGTGVIGPELRADLTATVAPAQVVETVLRVLHHSANKITKALALDAPAVRRWIYPPDR